MESLASQYLKDCQHFYFQLFFSRTSRFPSAVFVVEVPILSLKAPLNAVGSIVLALHGVVDRERFPCDAQRTAAPKSLDVLPRVAQTDFKMLQCWEV